jgi:Protein of unknown function (DUF3887)
MRRLLLFVLCLLAACSSGGGKPADSTDTGAGPTPTRATIPVAQLQAEASAITDLLIAGKYDDVVSHFNAEMLLAMSAPSLKTAWESVAAEFGAYKSRGATVVSSQAGAFDSPVTFGSTTMKCRLSFDADGKVAGLSIVK